MAAGAGMAWAAGVAAGAGMALAAGAGGKETAAAVAGLGQEGRVAEVAAVVMGGRGAEEGRVAEVAGAVVWEALGVLEGASEIWAVAGGWVAVVVAEVALAPSPAQPPGLHPHGKHQAAQFNACVCCEMGRKTTMEPAQLHCYVGMVLSARSCRPPGSTYPPP